MQLYLGEKLADFFDSVPTMLDGVKSVLWSSITTNSTIAASNTTATVTSATPTMLLNPTTSTIAALGQSSSLLHTLVNPPSNISALEMLIKALTYLLMSVAVACKEVYMGMTTELFVQCAIIMIVYPIIYFAIESAQYLIRIHIMLRLERLQYQVKHFILASILEKRLWVKQLKDGETACVLFEMGDRAQHWRVHLYVVMNISGARMKLLLPLWKVQALHPSMDLGAEMWGASVLRSTGEEVEGMGEVARQEM